MNRERSSRRGRRAPWALLVGLIAWSMAVAGLHRGHPGDFGDDGLYLVSARALRDGKGYVLPSRPGPPVRSRYPVGTSALIAAGLRLAPGPPTLDRDVAVARGVILASGWAYGLAAFAWLRRSGASRPAAELIAIASLFHLRTMSVSIAAMSDVPFGAVVLVLLARWARRRPAGAGRESLRAFLDGLLAGIGFLIRGNGIVLIPAALLASWRGGFRRRLGAAMACLLGAALGIVPLSIHARMASGSRVAGGYGREFAAGWSSWSAGRRVVAENLRGMARGLPDVVIPLGWVSALNGRPFATWGPRFAIGVVLLLGSDRLLRTGRRTDAPAGFVAASTLGLFAVWTWPFDERFVLALVPGILWAFAAGVGALARALGASRRAARGWGIRALVLVCAIDLMLAGQLVSQTRARGGLWGDPVQRDDLDSAMAYIRSRLGPEAVVIALEPEMVFLATGRQGLLLYDEEDRVARRPGRRDKLEAGMALAPGRPCYLLFASPGVDEGDDTRQVAAFSRSPGLAIREVYRSPHDRYRLAAIAARRPLGTAGEP